MNEPTAMRADASFRWRRMLDAKQSLRYKCVDRSQKGFNTLLIIKGDQRRRRPSAAVHIGHNKASPIRADITCGCKHCCSMTRFIFEKSNFVGSVQSDFDDRISLDLKLIHHVTH